jgi:hypothetical protein
MERRVTASMGILSLDVIQLRARARIRLCDRSSQG